jgi:hypothetical protein
MDMSRFDHPYTRALTSADIGISGIFQCLLGVVRVQTSDMKVVQAATATDKHFE